MSVETLWWVASTCAQVFAAIAALFAVFAVLLINNVSEQISRTLHAIDSDDEIWAFTPKYRESDRYNPWAVLSWISEAIERKEKALRKEEENAKEAELKAQQTETEEDEDEALLKSIDPAIRRQQIDKISSHRNRIRNQLKLKKETKKHTVQVTGNSLLVVGLSLIVLVLIDNLLFIADLYLEVGIALVGGSLVNLVDTARSVSLVIRRIAD